MGKAVIYEHLGAGQYSIMYTPDIAEIDARKAKLEETKTALDAQLYDGNGLIVGKAATQAVYDNATAAFNAALDAWADCAMQMPPCDDQAALMATVSARGTERAEAGAALTTISLLIAQNRADYFATTQEIAYLDNTKNGSGGGLMNAWCIDYDPAVVIPASTVVGTVETYGAKGGYAGGFLPRKWVNIQSSYSAGYLAARDHCVKPLSGIKTAAMFFNWCQWLYVMSRNPQYAVGVVQSKFDPHQNYLDLVLYGTTPGAAQPGGYPYIPGESGITLLNVPVNYLTCGAEAFLAGDQAIVRFGGINRTDPLVIGFASSPRTCSPTCYTDWPWHGLVKNGFLTLPNATSRIVFQPGAGDVFTLQLPGHTAPSRTEAEAAADLAAGMVWHSYKTFSGNTRRYNEKCSLGSISSWVWAVSSTEHWKVSASPATLYTAVGGVTTADITLTLEDMNLLTVADPSLVTNTIVIDQELAGTWKDLADGPTSVLSDMRIIDVSSDGAKVLLVAKRRALDIRECQRGFFLLQMNSTGSATLTVLADHVACNPLAPDISVPGFADEYSAYGYTAIPVWMWFDSSDVVETVNLGVLRTANDPTGDGTRITLGVGASVDSTYRSDGTGALIDGVAVPDLAGASSGIMGASEDRTETFHISQPQFNARRWISSVQDYSMPPPFEAQTGGITVIEPFSYSNKTVGLRVEVYASEGSGLYTVFTLVATYYGSPLHPGGPTDPGTWMSNDGAAPFTLYTPPAGPVKVSPSGNFGSYNIKTGQLIRNQTEPVCYV